MKRLIVHITNNKIVLVDILYFNDKPNNLPHDFILTCTDYDKMGKEFVCAIKQYY